MPDDEFAIPAQPTASPLHEAFNPTRPQRGSGLIGRRAELRRIVEAIEDEQAHVALYAKRGQGKTSLANRASELLRSKGFCVGRYVCDGNAGYEAIIRGLARDIPRPFLTVPVADGLEQQGCAAGLLPGPIDPSDLIALPSRLNAPHLVLVIDEFDRVQDEATRELLADTLKQASDRAANLSFMIVGVSTTLDRLLGGYASVQRNVASIHLQPLAEDEIEAIIERGTAISGFAFPPVIIQEIIGLSCGSPYIAHLLGLRLSQSARERGSRVVNGDDLADAIRRIAEEANPDALASYSEGIARQSAAVRSVAPAAP